MECSTERPRWTPSGAGRSRPVGTSSIRGRRPNSSPIGSGSRRTPSTALNYWKVVCRCLATRPVPFFFNCRPILRPMWIAYPSSFVCCRRKDVTVSNSVTRVGMHHGSCASCRRKTSRFASPTTMTRQRLGNGRRTLSTFEVMVRAVATRDTIRRVPWRIGLSASSHGNRRGATCLCSSITIRRALHRSMPLS